MTNTALDRNAIAETDRRIRSHIRTTPVIEIDGADVGLAPGPLLLKLEHLQHSGSFKARGAFAGLLEAPVPAAGVVAASGGNHGAAVAYAAQRLGVPATVFVPAVSSPAKIARIEGYGARLVVGGERYDDARIASEAHAASTGAATLHAYDQFSTLRGQGTLGLELEGQQPGITTLLVAVGGGGLIGGLAAWYRGRIRLVAVEPETAPTLHMALAAGHPVDAPAGGIAADSLAPRRVGTLMFPLARDHVASSVLVPDDAIAEAQRRLWQACRLAVEPGGATALAALISGAYRPARDEKVAVLVCGANITMLP